MARPQKDLTPYTGCNCDQAIGLDPLAVGFVSRKYQFETGPVPTKFLQKLLPFCHPSKTVCQVPRAQNSALGGKQIEVDIQGEKVMLGAAEIRVIGNEDIFAAPDLIYHYVADHNYLPPDEFIEAVMSGPSPDSAEFKALINTLRTF
ncbi:MAG: hypothetical protein AB8G95_24375 [Anaerolineae bacterium]